MKWSLSICDTTRHSTAQVWHKSHSHFTRASGFNATKSVLELESEPPRASLLAAQVVKGSADLTWNSNVSCHSLFISTYSYTRLRLLCHKKSKAAQERTKCLPCFTLTSQLSYRRRETPDTGGLRQDVLPQMELWREKNVLLESPAFCWTGQDSVSTIVNT